MKQPIQVLMLPTEDYTGIVSHSTGIDNLIHTKESAEKAVLDIGGQHQHLYITVSQDVEEIKEGDWLIHEGNPILQFEERMRALLCKDCKKIIATTDPKLTSMKDYHGENTNDITKQCYNGVPQLQQSFLKEFVANPDDKYVVEYESYCKYGDNCPSKGAYNKQHLCNVSYKLKVNQDNTVNISSVKKKMYSRKEVIDILDDFNNRGGFSDPFRNGEEFDNWIKENL